MVGELGVVALGIDYFAVVVGALTGALFACDRKLDIIGAIACGLLTGYGGGVIRDILLDHHGFYFMLHPDLVILCVVLVTFVFFFQSLFKNLDALVFFADALSVGLFALAGASKAFGAGVDVVFVILLGAITGVGGGTLRDISVGEVPGVFQESNYYAVAGLGGALAYAVLRTFGIPELACGFACVFTVVLLRYWSVVFDWRTAPPRDLGPAFLRDVFHRLRTAYLKGGRRVRRAKLASPLFKSRMRTKRSEQVDAQVESPTDAPADAPSDVPAQGRDRDRDQDQNQDPRCEGGSGDAAADATGPAAAPAPAPADGTSPDPGPVRGA